MAQQERCIVIVRHGDTDQRDPHQARQLTELGMRQARNCGQRIAQLTGISRADFGLVVSSEIDRAVQSARLAMVRELETIIQIPEIFPYDDEEDPFFRKVLEIFYRLGHKPLSEYYEQPDADVILAYGHIAWGAVLREMVKQNAMNVAVFSHGILTQAMTAAALDHANVHSVFNRVLGPCEGNIIKMRGLMTAFTDEV